MQVQSGEWVWELGLPTGDLANEVDNCASDGADGLESFHPTAAVLPETLSQRVSLQMAQFNKRNRPTFQLVPRLLQVFQNRQVYSPALWIRK